MSKAYPGDEIYFHHKGVPKSGKVKSIGRHGCIVDSNGEEHRLKWEHINGHKSRVKQKYTVVEQGEDGIIVQNEHGHKRFLATPPESKQSTAHISANQ